MFSIYNASRRTTHRNYIEAMYILKQVQQSRDNKNSLFLITISICPHNIGNVPCCAYKEMDRRVPIPFPASLIQPCSINHISVCLNKAKKNDDNCTVDSAE